MCKSNISTATSLRVPSPDRGRMIRITVDGNSIRAYEGETVHAALTAAGIVNMNRTSAGDPRGIFCGMGICYECLVTINGEPGRRACMTPVIENMIILTGEPL
ncbi:MAG: (2Fe-2S)-binding protein [Desulfobacterales bacterium]|nr:(2Fe-2S)-binding protein [Desulfobacterales bacterium]